MPQSRVIKLFFKMSGPLKYVFSYIATLTICALSFSAYAQDSDSKDMLETLVGRNILKEAQARDLSKLIASVNADATKSNKLTLQLRMQAMYEYLETNSHTQEQTNMFDIRRCHFVIRSESEGGWGLEANVDPSSANFLRATYIYKKIDTNFANWRIDFGYAKPKFIYEQNLSGFNQYATERSIVNNFWCSNFNQKGCIGLGGFHTGIFTTAKISNIEGLELTTAITSPTSNDAFAEKSPDSIPALWVGIDYTTHLYGLKTTFALNGAYGAQSNHQSFDIPTQSASIFQANPSIHISSDNFRANIDFVFANIKKGKFGNKTATPFGLISEAEYFIPAQNYGKIAPVIRYAYLDSDGRGFSADNIERHLKKDSTNTTYNKAHSIYFGINWYILGNDLKIQIGYEHLFYSGSPSNISENHKLHENAIRTVLQTQF